MFGPVASDTTALRALGEIGDGYRAAIGRARAAARAHVWAQMPGGVPESRFAGGLCQPGMIVLRVDGTIKRTYGHHPLACWIDNTGELASLLLRPGNAGANTATDLITVLSQAIAQIPDKHRSRLLVTSDGAGASHDLINWLVEQPDIVDFSVGFDIDADLRAAIITLRRASWVPALNNTTGAPREDADVADITTLMRSRIERCGWPKNLTFTVRRTKLAPGESDTCTLFHINGYKYSCFVTANADLPLHRRDARHRAHARVEDGVRTGKDTGLGCVD